MATQVQFRRGTTTENNAFTGAAAELTVDTTLTTLRVHDGTSAGGIALINANSSQVITNKTYGNGNTWEGNPPTLTYGGTGKSLTAVQGGIVYSDSDSMEISLAGTAGQVLTSGGTAAPIWVTPSSLTVGTASVATTASNIAGGSAGYIVYQFDTDDTSFIEPGASGTFLRSTGASTAPDWATASVTFGSTEVDLGATSTSIAGLTAIDGTTGMTSVFDTPTGNMTMFSAAAQLTLGTGTVLGNDTTQNLWNTVATTVNAFGAATTIDIGASTGTMTINNNQVVFNTTDSIQIPVGTTAQRDGTPAVGQIRYNSTISSFEGYGPGNAWGSLGGVKDVDQDTYITTETSAGSDEDTFSFYNAGTNTMSLDGTALTLKNDTYLIFDTDATAEPASHTEGALFYSNEYKALTYQNDITGSSLQIGLEEWIRVFNNTGSTITNGTPVYITGATGETPTVAPADATTAMKAEVIGIVTNDIPNNSSGVATTRGLISGFDTSALTAGERVHVSAAGALQNAAPTYPYYPTDIGTCIVSDATNGYIYVTINEHTMEQMRVTGNQHVDGSLTITGDLTVSGTQTITSQANLALDNAFIYMNSGDTIGEVNTTFSGSGLDDAYFTGHFEGTASTTYYVRIDGVGTGTGGVDTFEWSKDNFSTTEATGVDLDSSADVALDNNIKIHFNAETGHTSGDTWSGTAAPLNVDTGWASNRNTGASGVGYTHIGCMYDIASNQFIMFDEYDPEIEGNIDTAHASFQYGNLQIAGLTATTGAFSSNATVGGTLGVTGAITGASLNLSTGAVTAGSLDISGNADIDGTMEADAYTVNGTALNEYIADTVGAMVSSNTESGISVTYDDADNTLDFNVNDPTITLTGAVTGSATMTNLGNVSIATTHTADPTITLGGDLSGSVTLTNLGSGTLTATINANSVALGTDTTGNYVATVAAGSGLTVSGSGSETAAVTVSHADTSSQASVNNSGNTYIQDITLDTFGHITGITSATVTPPTRDSLGIDTNDGVQFASLGIGTTASGTTGEIRATGDITANYSDARLKKFEGTIDNALEKVMSLNGYYFRTNERAKEIGYVNDDRQVGVSAQEVQDVLPEIIADAPINDMIPRDQERDYKTVHYEKLVPLLIEAMKEQQKQIDELKKKLGE